MSDYLQQANNVLKEVQNIRVKLNLEQCDLLMARLADAINGVNSQVRCAGREFDLVLSELYRVTLRVESLLLDCCYSTQDNCILSQIIAASQVTDSRQRFLKLHAELRWCLFLISCIVEAPRRPSLDLLGNFDWDETVNLIGNDITVINAANKDRMHLVKILKQSLEEPGDHHIVCKCLLSRLGERVDPKWELGIPLVTNRTALEDSQGGQGTIDVVFWKNKLLVEKTFNDLTDGQVFRKEAEFLGRFSHPHILSMICSYEQPEGYGHIMMEKFSQDLHAYISTRKSLLAPLEAAEIILQISEGMHYLHTVQKVAHRDLKPKNVLVKEHPVFSLKVSDFGLAKVKESVSARSEQTANCGTTLYRAPEMFAIPDQDFHHKCEFKSGAKARKPCCVTANAFKADVYSFAVTCFFILTGEEPYKGHRLGALYDVVKVKGLRPVLPVSCPPILSWIIKRCWHPDSSQRPSFSEICKVLRTLKALLLTGGSGFSFKTGKVDLAEPGSTSLQRPEKHRSNKRILVIGRSNSGKEKLIDLVCGFSNGPVNDAESGRWTPDSTMCLVNTGDLESKGKLSYLKSIIMSRNRAYTFKSMKQQWYELALHSRKRVEQADPLAYRDRIHLLLLVYSLDNPPGHELTILKNICDLPIQILLTQTNEKHDPNGNLYLKKLHVWEESFLAEEIQVELKKIVKVNFAHITQGDGFRTQLWDSCEASQTEADIKFVSKIISWVYKRLGRKGFVVPEPDVTSFGQEYSLPESTRFVFKYLCDWWDVPSELAAALKEKIKSLDLEAVTGANDMEIRSGKEFVLFCVRCAGFILYSKGLHPNGWLSGGAFPLYSTWDAEVNAYFCFASEELDERRFDERILSHSSLVYTCLQEFLQHAYDQGVSLRQQLKHPCPPPGPVPPRRLLYDALHPIPELQVKRMFLIFLFSSCLRVLQRFFRRMSFR